MKESSSFSSMAIWSLLGSFALQGLSFFSAPIFTRLLSPVDYGQVSLFATWTSLLSLVIGLQCYGSIGIAMVKIQKEEINPYLSSIMTISVLSFSLILFGTLVFINPLSRLLGFTRGITLLLIVESFFSYCVSFLSRIWLQEKKAKQNSLLSFVLSLSAFGISLLLVLTHKENRYIWKLWGNAIPTLVCGFIVLCLIYKNGRCFYNKKYWSFCLAFSLPLILHGASGLIQSQSDRVMLKYFLDAEQVGIYSIAYTLGTVVNIIWEAFNKSLVPFYYDYMAAGDFDKIKKDSNGYLFTFTVIIMGFILLSREVFKILAPEPYWAGLKIIPIIAFGYYLNFLYSFPANHEFYNEKTKLISFISSFAAIINIVLNIWFIPKWGIMGAAVTTAISLGSMFILHDLSARFIVKDYKYSYLFYLKGLVPVLMTIALYYLLPNMWYIRWGLGVFLGIILLYRFIKRKSIF